MKVKFNIYSLVGYLYITIGFSSLAFAEAFTINIIHKYEIPKCKEIILSYNNQTELSFSEELSELTYKPHKSDQYHQKHFDVNQLHPGQYFNNCLDFNPSEEMKNLSDKYVSTMIKTIKDYFHKKRCELIENNADFTVNLNSPYVSFDKLGGYYYIDDVNYKVVKNNGEIIFEGQFKQLRYDNVSFWIFGCKNPKQIGIIIAKQIYRNLQKTETQKS